MNANDTVYIFHVGAREMQLKLPQAFVLAHLELVATKFDSADSILRLLEQHEPQNRQIKLLRARCRARRDDAEACHVLLKQAFADEPAEFVEGLYEALVDRRFLLANAILDVRRLMKKRKDLPGVMLFLGDTLLAVGRLQEAVNAWASAMQRDTPEGLAALAAKHQLQKFAPQVLAEEPKESVSKAS